MPLDPRMLAQILRPLPDITALKQAIIADWNNVPPAERKAAVDGYWEAIYAALTPADRMMGTTALDTSLFWFQALADDNEPQLPAEFFAMATRDNKVFRDFVYRLSDAYKTDCPQKYLDAVHMALGLPGVLERELAATEREARLAAAREPHNYLARWALDTTSRAVAIAYLTFDKALYLRALELKEDGNEQAAARVNNPIIKEILQHCDNNNLWVHNTSGIDSKSTKHPNIQV